MENIMMDIMYKAPSDETLKTCRITEDVVKERENLYVNMQNLIQKVHNK